MNFFERQEAARRGSRRLIWLFALAVIVIVSLITLAVAAVLIGGDSKAMEQGSIIDQLAANAGLLAVVAFASAALIGISSLVRISSLSEGGAAVARQLGGVPVSQDTTDLQLRRLRNVVEEIAIASGVPVPSIYVLEKEPGINAFAAGYSPSDAAVAVTRGALERLNRAELQGVIAHEFSHVLNGDMRLNIRLMGVLFGILVISIIGRKVLVHTRGGRDSKGVAAILLIALSLVLIGYAGLFFGRLIKAGVSRQREYLADASAVQFTRQTDGLAGALKKIAGVAEGSKLAAADGEEVSHMLFGEGLKLSSMMATHPPLLDRIKALDPTFNAKAMADIKTRYRNQPPSGMEEDRAMGLDGGPHPAPSLAPAGQESGVRPGEVSGQVAHPASDDYLRAGVLHDALPEILKVAARSVDGAVPLVMALLLDSSDAQRDVQRALITGQLGAGVCERVDELHALLADLHASLRLPLAALAFPALRRRPRTDLERFLTCCDALIHVDGKVGLFEYSLARLLRIQVIDSLDPSRGGSVGRRKLSASTQALADLFGVLAHQGHQDAAEARQAYSAGLATLLPQQAFAYAPSRDWVRALDSALTTLDELEPRGKQLLVEGLVTTIGHDGQMTVAEAELLRTICAVLHCPLPPVLDR